VQYSLGIWEFGLRQGRRWGSIAQSRRMGLWKSCYGISITRDEGEARRVGR